MIAAPDCSRSSAPLLPAQTLYLWSAASDGGASYWWSAVDDQGRECERGYQTLTAGGVAPASVQSLLDQLSGCVACICHSARQTLRPLLERLGLPPIAHWPRTVIDTEALSRAAFPGRQSYRLQELMPSAADPLDRLRRLYVACRERLPEAEIRTAAATAALESLSFTVRPSELPAVRQELSRRRPPAGVSLADVGSDRRVRQWVGWLSHNPQLPLDLRYWVGRTGRWGGYNDRTGRPDLYALPRHDHPLADPLRRAIALPEGLTFVTVDLKGFGARALSYLSNCRPVIDLLDRHPLADLYHEVASRLGIGGDRSEYKREVLSLFNGGESRYRQAFDQLLPALPAFRADLYQLLIDQATQPTTATQVGALTVRSVGAGEVVLQTDSGRPGVSIQGLQLSGRLYHIDRHTRQWLRPSQPPAWAVMNLERTIVADLIEVLIADGWSWVYPHHDSVSLIVPDLPDVVERARASLTHYLGPDRSIHAFRWPRSLAVIDPSDIITHNTLCEEQR